MMEEDERKLMMTVAWLFAHHGRTDRARVILECLSEDSPREGVVAATLADLQLAAGEPEAALRTIRAAEFPSALKRAEAMLETRALHALGKTGESRARWQRYVNASKGAKREWVKG